MCSPHIHDPYGITEPVKTRRYDSPRRREQAATTVAAIAAEAGVALETVYLAFETKGGLLRAIRSAAEAGPDAARLWGRIPLEFHENQRAIAATLPLRDGLDERRAADELWTLSHPDVWHLLVGERGWTPAEDERWFGVAACGRLLG